MPTMMTQSREVPGQFKVDPSILLASDSKRHGNTMHRALQEQGLTVEYAGEYAQLDSLLRQRRYDVVLLEVTSEHAVEPAVAAALRVKKGDAQQFVGYLADDSLGNCGLAGDAVFPRNAAKLPAALRQHMADGAS